MIVPMHTASDRERLMNAYPIESVSPGRVLCGCGAGLAAVCCLAAFGGNPADAANGQLAESARGRLAVEQASTAHRLEVYAARKIAHAQRIPVQTSSAFAAH